MYDTIFNISLLDIISWITFGFVVGIIVHNLKLTPSTHVGKDVVTAVLGCMVGGLTIVFFYGYPLLGTLTISIVVGIILATIYTWWAMHALPFHHSLQRENHQVTKA